MKKVITILMVLTALSTTNNLKEINISLQLVEKSNGYSKMDSAKI